MPQRRTLLADDGRRRIEHVIAQPHAQWGPVHRTADRRWVMPGTGPLEWRTEQDVVLVDELTAVRIEPGESYQLKHDGERHYVVLSTPATQAPGAARQGWLVAPSGLLRWRIALRRMNESGSTTQAVAALRRVLAASRMLPGGAEPASLRRARRLLMNDAASTRTLEEIGEAAHASPFHLERLARRHLGVSLHQYRLRLRVAAAIERLAAGERDLAGLAHDLGFSSQSHFGAVFRRETGCTPGRARELLAP
jgi:AraC-like DNA-binding protein